MEINEIKDRLPILSVLTNYGLKPDKNSHIQCPFHDDDKPSCKIYPETGTYYCFACGAKGDQVQFIQDMEKCSRHEAILKAKKMIGTEIIETVSEKKKSNMNHFEIFKKLQQVLPKSKNALEYLKSRELDIEKLEIGYNTGTSFKHLKNCIVFPIKDEKGNISSLYGRSINDNQEARHFYTANRKGIYPDYPPQETESLIITEAIIDAATLLQIPEITSQYTIISAYGTNGLVNEIKQTIAALENLKRIIFFFDGDKPGQEAVSKYTRELQKLMPHVSITNVNTPENEDINSLYTTYDKDCLIDLINEKKPINTSFSIETGSIEEKSVQAHSPSSPLNTENPNKITYETNTARYIVKGGLPKQLDKMLVSLDIQHLETGIKYRCRVDLYEEKQTRKEARESAEKLDLRSDLIENDLSQLCDLLEEHRENILGQDYGGQDKKDIQPGLAIQSKCKDFLSKPGLINRINELIGKSGITGEFNNRIFLFIIASSYKMPDTLHALIQGSSGSGKTHLLGKVANLMPQERVERFTRITDNSLYNYGEFELMHHLLCLEDVDGLKEEALFAWRELISNNMLRSSTSQKDDNGNSRGAKRVVRGPMASLCATTQGHIYEDNMGRLFIIAVDESPQQTARIIDYQSKTAAGVIKKEDETKAREFLQNCLRMLKPYKVVNPFADKVKLPQQAHKIRRLHELFLCFVKQITLINQYQRKKDAQGRLITEKKDLQTAAQIMFDSIFLKVDELDGSLRQFYEDLKQYIKSKPNAENYEFIQREIRFALFKSKSQLQRYINTLLELEYIQQTVASGKGNKYKILWWDNFGATRENLKKYLENQIQNL